MIHEMEEIIQIPSFSKHKHQLFKSFKHDTIGKITTQQFNIIVMEELLLLVVITLVSITINRYDFIVGIIIAYVYHAFGHFIQSIALKSYAPGTISGILSSLMLWYLFKTLEIDIIKYLGWPIIGILLIILNLILMYKINFN